MTSRHAFVSLISLLLLSLPAAAQDGEKITYEDQVRPLLENKCFSCHNPDKKKGDLDLTSFGGLITGGGGGAIVDSGNSTSSRLWTTCAKKEEPFMPPEGTALNAKELEILAKWIAGGLLETKSSVAKKSTKPKVEMAVMVTSGKPAGPIAKPENVLLQPVVVTPRTTAVTAIAASPWTSLVAFAAPKQILLYDTDTRQLAGILPYAEGYARTLSFSRNGSLLIMGGGRTGKLGHAVVWDVKTGKRIVEVGKEFDQLMSADISPDQQMVAIGSPSKKVKVYNTATGEELYNISKHTEWIMGTSFSPDGVLLATSDRNGNVMVWEAANGGEFYVLGQHKGSCTDLAWRADSNLLASCSRDGSVILWEMNEGKQVATWEAHSSGTESIAFTPEGTLITCGISGSVRHWDIKGTKLADLPSQPDVATQVVALHDGKTCVVGNFLGEVNMYDLKTQKLVGSLSSNPPLIAQRIIESEKKATELVIQLSGEATALKKTQDAATAVDAKLGDAKKKSADVLALKTKTEAEINGLPGKVAELDKQIKDTQAKRQAQIEAIKKHEQLVVDGKKLETEVAALTADKAKLVAPEQAAKLAEVTTAIAGKSAKLTELKKAAAPQPPIAEFDKQIKAQQDQITALNNSKAPKTQEVEAAKKSLETWPKTIAEIEKQVADAKAVVASSQAQVEALKAQISLFQKLPTLLKAAQFNVGVLTEKENLAKLEATFGDYTAAKKDNEDAKVSNAAKIEASKKIIADSTGRIPQADATLAKLKAELNGTEQAVTPTKAADVAANGNLEEHKKMITAREAELAALTKTRDEAKVAAKKSIEDIIKLIDTKKKSLAEVAAKLAAPQKTATAKQAVLTALDTALAAAKTALAAATMAAAEKLAAFKAAESAVAPANAALASAEKSLNQNRTNLAPALAAIAAAKKELAAKAGDAALTGKVATTEKAAAASDIAVATAQKELDSKKATKVAISQAFEAAKNAHGTAGAQVTTATKMMKQAEQQQAAAKNAFVQADKVAAPFRAQSDSISKEIDAQSKARDEKSAVPAALEAAFVSKSQPIVVAITQFKAALPPLEKAFADTRAKLEAELKIVEAKKSEVTKATELLEATKKQKAAAEAALAAAEKDNPVRDKNLVEITTELTKLQPQLDPLRAKVKQLETQYFTMLPK